VYCLLLFPRDQGLSQVDYHTFSGLEIEEPIIITIIEQNQNQEDQSVIN